MSPPRGRRLLSDAEIEIWLRVVQSVAPRSGAVLPQRVSAPAKPEISVRPDAAPKTAEKPRRATAGMPSYSPPTQAAKPAAPPLAPFEKRFRQKVTHGRIDIDGVIDLHGMTQAQAHAALIGFLRSSHGRGARLVLVVTGKGRSRLPLSSLFETEPGVLRRAVPHWLREPDLRSIVLGFEEAGVPHGGMGALYVRLRKR
ncbi:Smr/MutS family protein [Lichenihabitans sp. PAMC28606]|uniref:Smr/MutS family protein n=1 Tax=Lichenihabitans sp. PAMC28606 TaxID=2880932 RepID=UPI001D0B4B43|nr:Smr/MutS family protein [Lichenihabitans sp. PAMC28606]UDL95862.1 Smr/MutS family protein [Lichenihabitans sp. PAMC28606]